MDKPILVFGDSNTYGDGLSDSGLVEPWKQHSQLSWPYHMFPKTQIKNLAYPGCSNDTICLKLIRHASKDNTILIMFSTPTRIHMIKKGFNLFIKNQIEQFQDCKQIPLHFVGSICFYLQDELKECLKKNNMNCGNILRRPIDGLVKYHLNNSSQ